MTHYEDQFPREETDTQSFAYFDSEAFIKDALAWGHTPIKNLPEQAIVCDLLVDRIRQAAPADTDPLIVDYMSIVYQGRFHERQARNNRAYESRLNVTDYQDLEPDVRLRRDKSMIGVATFKESIQLQDEQEMGSNEIARSTHPFRDAEEECDAVRDGILEACATLDPGTRIPSTGERWKVRGSDVISLVGGEYDDARPVRALFITRKTDVAYMPTEDTMIVERHTYILDLDAFAANEPRVAELLRSYDVRELGPAAWTEKMTELWRDIDATQPLITADNRHCMLDLSTTFYTVNQTRLALIAERDALLEYEKAQHPHHSQSLREHIAARRDETSRKLGGLVMGDDLDDVTAGSK